MYSVKDLVQRTKRQATNWEEMFAKLISDKEFVFKLYQKLSGLNSKKITWVKMGKDLKTHLDKEDVQIVNNHMKLCSTSSVIRKLEIKTTVR